MVQQLKIFAITSNQVFLRIQIFYSFLSGTNDVTNGINTTTKVRKLVPTIEQWARIGNY